MAKNALRILVVDDDIDLLMLLERKLQQQGYCVESAASLAEAEYVASLFKPQLVLIDINVGGEDGRQLCWKIKHAAGGSQTKVVLMSGLFYPTSRTLLFGADDFVAKPFATDFLLQRLTAQLQNEEPAPVFTLPMMQKAEPVNLQVP
jgi:DNA-binding response OmpR family regulator